jgi:hypothetical protein
MSAITMAFAAEANAVRSYITNGGCDGGMVDWMDCDVKGTAAKEPFWGPHIKKWMYMSVGAEEVDWIMSDTRAASGDKSFTCNTVNGVQDKIYLGHYVGANANPHLPVGQYWIHLKFAIDVNAQTMTITMKNDSGANPAYTIVDTGTDGVWRTFSGSWPFDGTDNNIIEIRVGPGTGTPPDAVYFDSFFMRPSGLCEVMGNQVIAYSHIVQPVLAFGGGTADANVVDKGGYAPPDTST